MNVIRIGSAALLAVSVAGCAAKGPDATASLSRKKATPVVKAQPVTRSTAEPARVVTAAPSYSLPEYVSVEPSRPAPRPVPQARRAPMVDVGPLQAALPRYEAPAPMAVPLPEIATRYEAVPEPVPVPVYEAAEALPGYSEPAYVETASLAAAPSLALTRSMAPIYDEPNGGRDPAETRIHARKVFKPGGSRSSNAPPARVRSSFTPAFGRQLESAAIGRLNPSIRYDARYVKIGYPWGDVPESTGVCTDVIIRSYRQLGIDLQQLVHDDMRTAFVAYPSREIYGLREADPNIDHRRVVNLEAFFERAGASVPVGSSPEDFRPGDVVTWRLNGSEPHTGIVIGERDPRSRYPLVVHNLGAGVRKDDMLSIQRPVGQYRFAPDTDSRLAMARGPRRSGG